MHHELIVVLKQKSYDKPPSHHSTIPFVKLDGELFERIGLAKAHGAPVFGTHDDIQHMVGEALVKRVELDEGAVLSESVTNKRRLVHDKLDVDVLYNHEAAMEPTRRSSTVQSATS